MRIGCLQFAPQVGDIDNNLSRADAVLSKASPENLDLLVLPELAFTGMIIRIYGELPSVDDYLLTCWTYPQGTISSRFRRSVPS